MSVPHVLIVAVAPGLADQGARLLASVPGLSVNRLSYPWAALDWVTREPVDLLVIELPLTPEAASLVRTARSRRPRLAVLGLCCSQLRSQWSGPLPSFECDEVLVLPFEPTQFVETVQRLAFGEEASPARSLPPELAGTSPALQELRDLIARLAPLDVEVLVEGPAGSPRAAIAHRLHALGEQASGSFVNADCRLAELEHGPGDDWLANARKRWTGLFSASAGGVLFLDHVDCLAKPFQAILQSLLTRHARASRSKKVRLVSAAEAGLEASLEKERFRSDLYYRLSTVKVEVPPLERRPADIPEICEALLDRLAHRNDRPALQLSDPAKHLLVYRSWPGDVAELEQVIETAAGSATGGSIEERDVAVALERIPAKQT